LEGGKVALASCVVGERALRVRGGGAARRGRNQFPQEFVGELAGHCKTYCQTVSYVLSKEHTQVIDL